MVDPVASPLILASLIGAGSSAAAGIIGNKGGESPGAPVPPPTLIPASQPTTAKPKPGGMQQSFLSGVAGAQLPGAGTQSGGKTLLGA